MEDVRGFYDLTVWKKAHAVTLCTYKVTELFPSKENYSITDQMRRASSSVSANIAEGYGRYHPKDRVRFLYLSRGSNKELQNFLLLARDLEYLPLSEFNFLWENAKEVERLINGYIRSIMKLK